MSPSTITMAKPNQVRFTVSMLTHNVFATTCRPQVVAVVTISSLFGDCYGDKSIENGRYLTVFLGELFRQLVRLLQIPRLAVIADARQAPGRHRQVHQLQTDVGQILPHAVHLVLVVVAVLQALQVQDRPAEIAVVHRGPELHETFVQVVGVVSFALLATDLNHKNEGRRR